MGAGQEQAVARVSMGRLRETESRSWGGPAKTLVPLKPEVFTDRFCCFFLSSLRAISQCLTNKIKIKVF